MYVGLVCPYSLLKACTSVLVEGNAIAEEAILLNKAHINNLILKSKMLTKIDKIGEWLLQVAHICASSYYAIARRLGWLD